ncbi:MAG TPA: EamA family transporter [Acidobacteriaceae bacterium]|nr:EamA family transporter [Acidobacteriaceae bacterium]
MNQHATRDRSLGFAACCLASMFWGCGFFFGKIALAEMNSGAMVLYRFLFCAIGLLPFLLTHRPGFNRREWLILLAASILGVPLQFLFQFHGLALTTVSHAALMVGTMPVILAVGATIFAHERLHAVGWAALVVSTIGAALIALGGTSHAEANGPTLRGDLYVVLSLCIALFWVLLNQRLVMTHSAVVVTAYGLCAGTLMLLLVVPPLYGLPPVHGVSLKAWLALGASGLLCTASSTLLWNWGMTKVPASQAAVLLNMEPLIGSLLGIFVLHETLGPVAWIGGAMILLAAIVLTTRGHPPVASIT